MRYVKNPIEAIMAKCNKSMKIYFGRYHRPRYSAKNDLQLKLHPLF